MENASKALIMAGSILIGLLILSVTVYLFVTFGATSRQIHAEIDASRLNEFNTQFTSYETKDDNTIYDIISIVNLARENNNYYQLAELEPGNLYIQVSVKLKSGISEPRLEKYSDKDLQELAKKEIHSMVLDTDTYGTVYKRLPIYSCKVTINNETKRVQLVTFTSN